MDRRTLLKSAAAIPAAALVPTIPALAEAAQPSVPIVPLSVKPYTNYVWEWFVSHDRETYYEGFPTKEEALQYAQQCDYSVVAECVQRDFRLDLDGWWIIEKLNDDNEELIGESEGLEATHDQQLDLGKMVQKAIEAWVVKHNINITAWSFDSTRNETDVREALALSNGERA